MLLTELAPAALNNPTVKAAAAAISPLWKFKAVYVDPKNPNTVQFRQDTTNGAEDGYNSLDFKTLGSKLQDSLHQAGVQYQQAGFQEIPRNFSAPLIAYVVQF